MIQLPLLDQGSLNEDGTNPFYPLSQASINQTPINSVKNEKSSFHILLQPGQDSQKLKENSIMEAIQKKEIQNNCCENLSLNPSTAFTEFNSINQICPKIENIDETSSLQPANDFLTSKENIGSTAIIQEESQDDYCEKLSLNSFKIS